MTTPPNPSRATQGLMPAGQRYGQGAQSVTPYLRDAWRAHPNNPVFTAQEIAELVWPSGRNTATSASTSPADEQRRH